MSDYKDILNLKYAHNDIEKKLNILMGGGEITKTSLNELNSEMEAYAIGVESLKEYCVENNGSRSLVEACLILSNDGVVFENALKNLSCSLSLNESRYGFFNPFDDMVDSKNELPSVDIHTKAKKGMDILGIKLWNKDKFKKTNAYCDGESIYAKKTFFPDDIIENSPVRIFDNNDLFSRNIRELAFPIDPARRLYGLPLGYISYYKTDKDSGKEANVDYECYQAENGMWFIRIIAIGKINKNDELILKSSDDDYVNELHPYDFKYDNSVNRGAIYNANFKTV